MAVRRCPECDTSWYDIQFTELEYCVKCGTELVSLIGQNCHSCGDEVEDHWDFCGHCGSQLVHE